MVVSRKHKESFIAQNLLFLRKREEKTLEEMSDFLSLKSKSSYKAYEEGKAVPDIFKLMKLATFFDVSLENMVYKDISTLKPEKATTEILYEVEKIPVKAAAGYARSFGDNEYIDKLKTIKIPYKPYGIARAFEIDGDSMEPEIKNKTTVIGIKINARELKDRGIYIIVTDDGIQCKEIRKSGDTIYLISKNENHPMKHIESGEVRELWEVWKKDI